MTLGGTHSFLGLFKCIYFESILTDLKNKPVVTSGEKERRWGKIGVPDSDVQTTMYKKHKLQGYIVQHREFSQYFIITLNGV